ncbi:MAG TPA: pirin family protein [Bacteroidia bacterium]|jgi:redox-sensitive bicupin YhaK (pirin superfamily)|nr:pirin family protein [Bacteroidia bacterium]
MSDMIIHKAGTRGHVNHGWLNAYHSFSFASYYDPERVHFGMLRVLNDDTVAPGMGFGTHPHDNMEIITIPQSGVLEHKDSMGNHGIISSGDIQVMSAGTGIQHSEFNHSKEKEVKLLQIWVFPNKKNVAPRYGQMTLDVNARKNKLQQIVSPNPDEEGLWIHQDAWFHMINLGAGKKIIYNLKKQGNGVYCFILDGDVNINGQELNKRDGAGIKNKNEFELIAKTNSEVLLMEIPMID